MDMYFYLVTWQRYPDGQVRSPHISRSPTPTLSLPACLQSNAGTTQAQYGFATPKSCSMASSTAFLTLPLPLPVPVLQSLPRGALEPWVQALLSPALTSSVRDWQPWRRALLSCLWSAIPGPTIFFVFSLNHRQCSTATQERSVYRRFCAELVYQ